MASPAVSQSNDRASDYYYFVVAIAVIAVLLLLSNMIVVGCCSRCSLVQAIGRFLCSRGILSGPSEDDHISQLIPARKYNKEAADVAAAGESECSVCLMPFVEGEEVRQLPKCRHCFHAPCIDMWLYSHTNCPMCRAKVLPEAAAREVGSQSRRSLIESGDMTSVIVSIM